MNNSKYIFLSFLAVFIIFCISFIVVFDFEFNTENVIQTSNNDSQVLFDLDEQEDVKPTPTPTPSPTPIKPDTVINIMAAGDTMVHGTQLEHDYNEDPDIYDFAPSFSQISSTIQRADFAMVNLETTISGKELGYSGYPDFNTPESFITALKDCGFDLLTLANNHTIDRGEKGVENTLKNLDRLGVDHTGISLDEKSFYDYYIKDINGINVAVIAYSWENSGVRTFENKDYIMRFWDNPEMVRTDIENVKNLGAEVVIIVPHWGEEYHRNYTREQEKLAKLYVSYGADIIFGSHPHVAQPIEKIAVEDLNGKMREGIVVYSLGNFLANMRNRYNNTGVIVNIQIRKTANDEIKLGEITYIPTYIKSTQIYKIEASDHVILPAGKYANNLHLLSTLDEKHQENIVNAYSDIMELVAPDIASVLDE